MAILNGSIDILKLKGIRSQRKKWQRFIPWILTLLLVTVAGRLRDKDPGKREINGSLMLRVDYALFNEWRSKKN